MLPVLVAETMLSTQESVDPMGSERAVTHRVSELMLCVLHRAARAGRPIEG